jgi:ribosomal protein S18 acetylase RimI-like enzyme
MEIQKAKSSDLIEILYLLKECVRDMNQKGMKHWNSSYPGIEDIDRDLNKESIFLIKDKGICMGMVTLNEIEPEEYKGIHWSSNDSKTLYMKRMAVNPIWQDKGIAEMLVKFAEKYARENKYNYIRLDTLSSNQSEAKLYANGNYNEVGEFHSTFQKTPFKCYEKKIKV